jgi:hypothetical protein
MEVPDLLLFTQQIVEDVAYNVDYVGAETFHEQVSNILSCVP